MLKTSIQREIDGNIISTEQIINDPVISVADRTPCLTLTFTPNISVVLLPEHPAVFSFSSQLLVSCVFLQPKI